jgi:hypothetical protein
LGTGRPCHHGTDGSVAPRVPEESEEEEEEEEKEEFFTTVT